MRGRPKAELVLSDAEREQLTALTLRRKTAQALALRARIVLACAEGVDNKVVASRQRVTPQTVSKWRARFVEHRLDGLLDAPRPGAPRTFSPIQPACSTQSPSTIHISPCFPSPDRPTCPRRCPDTLYERATNTDRAGFVKRVHASIEKIKKHSILQKIRSSEDRFEISPTLKLLFSAEEIQALTHLYQRMAAGETPAQLAQTESDEEADQ